LPIDALTDAVAIIERVAPAEVETFRTAIVKAIKDALATTNQPKNASNDPPPASRRSWSPDPKRSRSTGLDSLSASAAANACG